MENIKKGSHKSHAPIVIILILFALRYPLLFLGEKEVVPTEFAYVIYLCATYLFSGIFIYINRSELEKYNITNISVLIFLFAPIMAIIMGNDYDPTLWIRFIISVVLGLLMFSKRNCILKGDKKSVRTIIINITFTIVLCIVIPILIHIIRGSPKIDLTALSPEAVRFNIKEMWFFQLSSASISEEPLFRGFFWGYMKKRGIKDIWVCLMQVMLFWFGHIYYIDTGINFWIVHPLAALLLGMLVWKTKSITYTMIFHSCINTFSDYLRFIPLFK